MKGWFIRLALLDDRLIIILFRIFRFGIFIQKKSHITEFSLLFGIYKFDIKISLGKLKDIRIDIHGNA